MSSDLSCELLKLYLTASIVTHQRFRKDKQMASVKYVETVTHTGLGKSRVISGSDLNIVRQKARMQLWEWEVLWEKNQEKELKRAQKEALLADAEAKRQDASQRTTEAQSAFDDLQRVLEATLAINDVVDWETLKDYSRFAELQPANPIPIALPREPLTSNGEYKPRLNIFARLIKAWRLKKEEQARLLYEKAHEQWKQICADVLRLNAQAQSEFESTLSYWERRKNDFEQSQLEANQRVNSRKKEYLNADPSAVIDYCDLVLSNSEYPEWMPGNWELDYKPELKLLIVELQLPDPFELSRLKEVKYVKTKDDFVESYHPDSTMSKVYDNLLYQICLRTLHELFEADVIDAVKYLVFNGIVESIDKSIGKKVTACVMSIHAEKEQFGNIELSSVEPKACFRKLKGISSSSLYGLAAIPPVMQIDRSDSRFIDARSVVDGVSAETNIASMDWADFEHLIRELFEKEFAQSGGEVKVTQASRDGGVDAIAFDPDPIRGGKIVIQAKRYTATVGVSAVRDLYGTVVNEGATKGILITTSDYGPDSYEFAKGKPITLLNGNNLLHLLANHGYKARIDIKEARQTMKAEGR